MTPKTPDYGHRQADKALFALTKRLHLSYRQASLDLQEKLSAYMEQFEKDDAMMRALYDSGELSHEDYMKWKFSTLAGTKQWKNMLNQLTDDLVNADKIAASMINDTLPGVYAENHNYGTYEIEHDLQMSTSYTLYNRDAVARLLKGNPDLLPNQPNVNVPKDERWNRQHLQSALLQGILTGESMKDIAKRFQNVVGMDERAAIRNARTAVTGAENAGKLDSMKRAQGLGVELKKLWLATRDGRTRDSHVLMDGELREVDEEFSNGCMYPGDPHGAPAEVYNCRCAMRSKVAGADPYSPDLSKNERLGEMSYAEWKQQAKERKTYGSGIDRSEKVYSGTGLRNFGKVDNYEDEIEKIKQRAKGNPTYRDIQEAGKLTRIERNRIYNESLTHLDNEMKGMQKARTELLKKFSGNYADPGFTIQYSKYKMELAALLQKKENLGTESLLNVLQRIRSVGCENEDLLKAHLKNGTSPMIKYVIDAYKHYPTSWIQKSMEAGEVSVRTNKKRGGYNPDSKRIGIGANENCLRTAIHEVVHRFEEVVPGLLHEEKKFYETRTFMSPLERLCDLKPEHGHLPSEKTRKDKFIDPYIGRDYNGKAYELASMGFEYVFMDPQKLAGDPEYETWILGLLTLM